MSDKFYWGAKLNVNKEEKAYWVYEPNAYDWDLEVLFVAIVLL